MASINTESPLRATTETLDAIQCPTCNGSGKLSGLFYRNIECDHCDAVGYVQLMTGQWLDSYSATRIEKAREQEEVIRKQKALQAARERKNTGTPDNWILKNNLRLD
ncbi:hypothetical protein GZ77_26755 [Endozoicomonas montiporae]|uniref:Uncharacterized protein n=1 Tax=Endozoicomonas montiporae TaxID=1027273 RepID=A0A081MYC5_9GAMM|nr:hypothetical protein [Endozoicomonas montiporae]KEQ11198.1 hypothetical protein GZ77_26755 [Endozoicomonas montiporae]